MDWFAWVAIVGLGQMLLILCVGMFAPIEPWDGDVGDVEDTSDAEGTFEDRRQ